MAVVMCVSLAAPAAAAASGTLQPYLDKIVSWGVMRGDINGNLNTEKTITRAEFVTMINRAFGFSRTGTTPFKDVPASAWYAEDVGIAYTIGYINGTTATTFSPYSSVTREQAAVILARILMLQPQVGENHGLHRQPPAGATGAGDWWLRPPTATSSTDMPTAASGPKMPSPGARPPSSSSTPWANPIQKAGEYSLGSTWGKRDHHRPPASRCATPWWAATSTSLRAWTWDR